MKAYNPHEIEPRLQLAWEEAGLYTVPQLGHQFTGELRRSTRPRSQNFRKIHWPQR